MWMFCIEIVTASVHWKKWLEKGKKGRLEESEEQDKNKRRKREWKMGDTNIENWEIDLLDKMHTPL